MVGPFRVARAKAAAPTPSKRGVGTIPAASGIGYVPATMVPLEVMGDIPFQGQVTRVSKKYDIAEDDLYRVMAFETGNSFSPAQRNNGGSSATGLIQFMTGPRSWARSKHGLTREKLSKMSRAEQMVWVDRFLSDHGLGKVQKPNLGDVYLTVLNPGFRGTARDFVHFREGSEEYHENRGFERQPPDALPREITTEDIVFKVVNHNVTGLGKYRPPERRVATEGDSNSDPFSRIAKPLLGPSKDFRPWPSTQPGRRPGALIPAPHPRPVPSAGKSRRPKPRPFLLDKYFDW